MILSTLLFATVCAPVAPSVPVGAEHEATVTWSAPDNHVVGESFWVTLEIQALEGATIPGAWLVPEGFTLKGKKLGPVMDDHVADTDLNWTLKFDLAPVLNPKLPRATSFVLGLAGSDVSKEVQLLTAAPSDLDFMQMDVKKLADYGVLLRTNRGDMLVEFWPETAPNHVRNFLDLAYTKFYDGCLFHRCIPGFMIQGGDPTSKDPKTDPRRLGGGNGPRKVDAEFSSRPHERGTLSAARLGNDVNSATSQFFICHARAASLDRQYSAFGQVRTGLEVIDAIVDAPKAIDTQGIDPRTGGPRRTPTDRPLVNQVIERAIVVLLPK